MMSEDSWHGGMEELRRRLRRFTRERDWEQFHSPKNLAMALSVETAELLEIFQWMTQAESANLDAAKREALRKEVGDVLIYLSALADRSGVDPVEAALLKMEENEQKYPAGSVRGRSDKYTEYPTDRDAD